MKHVQKTKLTKLTVKQPTELMTFLLETLKDKSRSSIKSMLSHRQVSIDNQVVTKFNYKLEANQVIEITNGFVPQETAYTGLKIVYEDQDVIVINKNNGLLSISTDGSNQLTAYSILREHVKVSNPHNKLFVVHRLDKDTSGLMLFAKSEAVKEKMQHNWKDIVLERTYILVVEGTVKQDSGTIKSWIKENAIHLMYSSQNPNDGDLAITKYTVVNRNEHFSLVEATLETGRKNQIRVHMKDLGHPIVGDKKYDAKTNPLNRLGLHAQLLAFIHPITGKEHKFSTPIPSRFLTLFE